MYIDKSLQQLPYSMFHIERLYLSFYTNAKRNFCDRAADGRAIQQIAGDIALLG
jgi:hypothetical protein